jgi:hypothetical protein
VRICKSVSRMLRTVSAISLLSLSCPPGYARVELLPVLRV